MERRNLIIIALCWAFAGPTEDGGVRRGESPVGASGSGKGQDVPLEEGLPEGGGQVKIVPCVGSGAISLESCRIPRIEEAVDGGRPIFWVGGPGGVACREDDVLALCKQDSLLPGNLPQAEQSFASNDAALEST